MKAPSPEPPYKHPALGQAAHRTRPHLVTYHRLRSAPLCTARPRRRLKHRGGAFAGPAPAPAAATAISFPFIIIIFFFFFPFAMDCERRACAQLALSAGSCGVRWL